MTDAATRRICDSLRRESADIAREAIRLFVQQAIIPGAEESSAAAGETQVLAAGARDEPRSPHALDEAEAIVYEGMVRLGGVVALGLQVDEPRLVAEELQWLELTICSQLGQVSKVSNVELIGEAFLASCGKVLGPGGCGVVAGIFVEARKHLPTLEPLLTNSRPSPNLEGNPAHDS